MIQHKDSSRFILPVIKTICNQLSSGHEPSSKSRTDASSLEILSNDIKESEEAQTVEDSDTDDEDALNGMFLVITNLVCNRCLSDVANSSIFKAVNR